MIFLISIGFSVFCYLSPHLTKNRGLLGGGDRVGEGLQNGPVSKVVCYLNSVSMNHMVKKNQFL